MKICITIFLLTISFFIFADNSNDINNLSNYLPQYKITEVPIIPSEYIQKNIKYPSEASKKNIEVIVKLKLFINKDGVITKIEIIEDPGYGFAEAAINGFKDKEGNYIKCIPAKRNGIPVAAIFKYPIKFVIKK